MGIDKEPKSLRQYMDTFSATTVIRGFSFIRLSGCWLEKCLWILVVSSFFALTAWDVQRSFEKYLSQPTFSKISIMNNKSIKLTGILLCIQINTKDLINQVDRATLFENLNTFANSAELLQTLRTSLPTAETEVLYDKIPDLQSLPDNNVSKLLPIIYATAALMSDIARVEHTKERSSLHTSWGLEANVSQVSNLILDLHKFYAKSGSNYSNLITIVTAHLCQLHNLHLYSTVGTGIDKQYRIWNPCLESNSYWLGPHPIFDFDSNCIYTQKQFEFENFNSLSGFLMQPVVNTTGLSFALEYTGSKGNGQNANPMLTTFGEKKWVQAEISGHYIRISLERSKCFQARNPIICNLECRTTFIHQNCKCHPLTNIFVPPLKDSEGFPTCGQSYGQVEGDKIPFLSSTSCRQLHTSAYPNLACSESCLQIQNCVDLLLSTISKPVEFETPENMTVLQLSFRKFIYPKIEESLLMEFRDFINILGSNLSLWLGASFLALIHIIVYFTKSTIEIACLNIKLK